jgi:hypothetical protein
VVVVVVVYVKADNNVVVVVVVCVKADNNVVVVRSETKPN